MKNIEQSSKKSWAYQGIRTSLWNSQNGMCVYCGKKMLKPGDEDYSEKSGLAATVDHVVPKSLGGRGGRNLVLACRTCNNKKADKYDGHIIERKPKRVMMTNETDGPFEVMPDGAMIWRG